MRPHRPGEWEPQTAADLGAINDQFDGGSHPRCFVLEIDPDVTDKGVHKVALTKNRTWSANSQIDEFNLSIAVHPRLHGVQLPEKEFALAR